MEQMGENLMFRWFVGLGIDDPVWVPTVFSKNRDRLLTTDMSRKVMTAILAHPSVRPLLSDEHASVTDPDARLCKKASGAAAMLCFMGHTLMENRNGLVVQADLTHADGHGERKAVLEMINRHSPGSTRRLTLGADKGHDSADFVAELRRMVVTPHVAQKARHSAIDGRTPQHPGYALCQQRRKKIDLRRENDPPDRFLILLTFGWAKTVGGMAQAVHRGLDRVRAQFTMTMAACNPARLPKLLAA